MPQPVDLHTEVARVAAAERIQQIAGRVSLAAQQRAAMEAQENRVEVEQQVQQTPESESEGVEEEARRKNPFLGQRKKRQHEEEDEASAAAYSHDAHEEHMGDDEGHQLDVTI